MTGIIKVDTIQNNGGTTAMTIDSSGRVIQSALPRFACHLSSSTAINSTSVVDAKFDTIDFNVGGHLAIASSVATFTAPLTGHYQISSSIITDGTESVTWANSMWYVNGDELSSSADLSYRTIEDPQGGAFQHHGISLLIALNANDTLNVKYRNSGDSTTNFRAGCRFTGFLVA